jgi:MarR family transcriptional regulator, transcriptional regulator for hemolysin
VLEFDVEQSVGCWVAQTSNALRRAMNDELAREGITFRQWEVLAWSASGEQLSQSELAERMGIEAQTLVGILSRMERDGWLERSCCPNDRRKKRFRPTPRAEAVWTRMLDCYRRVRTRATLGLSEADLANFKRTCEAIRQNLGPEPEALEPACQSLSDTAKM